MLGMFMPLSFSSFYSLIYLPLFMSYAANKGNKTENLVALIQAILIGCAIVVYHAYLLTLQTYV